MTPKNKFEQIAIKTLLIGTLILPGISLALPNNVQVASAQESVNQPRPSYEQITQRMHEAGAQDVSNWIKQHPGLAAQSVLEGRTDKTYFLHLDHQAKTLTIYDKTGNAIEAFKVMIGKKGGYESPIDGFDVNTCRLDSWVGGTRGWNTIVCDTSWTNPNGSAISAIHGGRVEEGGVTGACITLEQNDGESLDLLANNRYGENTKSPSPSRLKELENELINGTSPSQLTKSSAYQRLSSISKFLALQEWAKTHTGQVRPYIGWGSEK